MFDRLSPHVGGSISIFLLLTFSLPWFFMAENLERQHSTQNTANDTPKKSTPEKIIEGSHIICRSNSAS